MRDRRAKSEEQNAGLCTLEIECPWESDTDGITRLLYALQNDEVMFDVRKLLIRSDGKDRLSGSFTVNCVYTKPEGGP